MTETRLRISFIKVIILAIFAAVTTTASFAAKTINISYDTGNMPRCLSVQGNRGALVLHWDEAELYRRKVKATYYKWWLNCDNWEKGRSNFVNSQTTTINLNTVSVYGFTLSSQVRRAIKQVEFGGKIYRVEKSAKEFLSKYPIQEFTVAINRAITNRYGVGFAAEVYRTWLMDKTENRKIWNQITDKIKQASQPGGLPSLKARSKDAVLMFAPGLGQDQNKDQAHLPVNLSDIINDFKTIGLNVKVFAVKPKGSVEENAAVIQKELSEVLKSGKDVILAGGSKGVADMFGGVGRLADELGNLDSLPRSYGQIIAFVNISGVVRGSWVADRLADTKTYRAIHAAVDRLPFQWAKNMSEYMVGISEMTTEYCTQLMKYYLPRLPKNAPMFNLVGIVPGDGLGTAYNGIRGDSRVATIMQLFAKHMVGYFGANDGYLELPQMTLPSSTRSNDYSIPFASTHYILDGHFYGKDMTYGAHRRMVFKSLFHTVMDQVQK